jgi:hypothetical protein
MTQCVEQSGPGFLPGMPTCGHFGGGGLFADGGMALQSGPEQRPWPATVCTMMKRNSGLLHVHSEPDPGTTLSILLPRGTRGRIPG